MNKQKNNPNPSSYHEEKDRCPTCQSYIDIDTDLTDQDTCWECRTDIIEEKKLPYDEVAVNKLMELIKVTSQYNSFGNNLAKEYIIKEDGTYLILGNDCFRDSSTHNIYEYVDKTWKYLKKYTIGYGVSLTNVIILLERKKIKILNINRMESKSGYNYYNITILDWLDRLTHYHFKETYKFKEFATSELGYFLVNLYEKELQQ